VPTIANPHFFIDLPTLFAVTTFVSIVGGLVLVLAWLQNRRTTALLLWGIGYLFGATAAALISSPGLLPNSWSVGIANAFVCIAYGMMWSGARSFEGRHVPVSLVGAGAAVWLVAFQFGAFAESVPARISLMSAIVATYALLSARELWYARDRELLSRWPTMAVVVSHAGFLLARIPFADALALSVLTGQPQGIMVSIIAFQSLFTTFCLPLLRVAMSKERAELEQRQAAQTDTLTGVPNRRAFFDRGAALLEQALADRRSAALLLFDLDRFKEVNDTAGHQTGDLVLKAFCDLVTATIGRRDLFGRLGGEEFACLLADVSTAQALQIAERLRREFAAMDFDGFDAHVTVSAGVAMASETGRSLAALLATADRALYRAKAEGRNRVASTRPVLVEKSGGDIGRWMPERMPANSPAAG
jgi:diguanylate cyclase (GGDEF)-like protein